MAAVRIATHASNDRAEQWIDHRLGGQNRQAPADEKSLREAQAASLAAWGWKGNE